MGGLGISSVSFLYQIDVRYESIQQDFIARDRAIEELQGDIYLSGTHVRDYLTATDQNISQKEALAFFNTRS